MSNLNKMSVVTIVAAIGNILVVVYMSTYETSYISAILAWTVVITTQLSLISVRLKDESQ